MPRRKGERMMIEKKDRVVKARWADEKAITAWGGLALAERLAHRTRLWRDCRRLLPARTRTGAGYDSTAVAAAITVCRTADACRRPAR